MKNKVYLIIIFSYYSNSILPMEKWHVDEDAWEKEFKEQEIERKEINKLIKQYKKKANCCCFTGFICGITQTLGIFFLGTSFNLIKHIQNNQPNS